MTKPFSNSTTAGESTSGLDGHGTIPTSVDTAKPESHWRMLLGIGLIVTILGGGVVWRLFHLPLRKNTLKSLGPGLTLTSSVVSLPGDLILKTYVVRADRKKWQLHLAPAAPLVTDKAPVSDIVADYDQAHTKPAPVGVNGGFFAYDGAAVGAVKINDEWARLPWKNRTAIGWGPNERPRIENLQGRGLVLRGSLPPLTIDNLNGRPLANSLMALNKWYGTSYQLQTGETAVLVKDGKVAEKVTTGKVLIPASGFVLIAGTTRRDLDNFNPGESATLKIDTTPADWEKYPTILGAGPRLIRDTHIEVTQVEEEFRSDVTVRGPRTAIGFDRDGNIIILVVEGWQFEAKGIELGQLATELQGLGAVDGINLDGGSSTTLIAEGQLINKVASPHEVPVSNAVLIVPRETE